MGGAALERRPVLGDVGGTNARFAVVGSDGRPGRVRASAAADHAGFDEALGDFLADEGVTPRSLAISAAGSVIDGAVRLTNAPWKIGAAALSARFGGVPVHLVNDVEAVALALPVLSPDDTAEILAGCAEAGVPRLAVNLGTGFGAAVAVPTGAGRWTALATEAGHVHLDPGVFAASGAAMIEDVFSGPGLRRARSATPGLAPDRFRTEWSRLLGRIVRDLVQTTGAWGGVHFCGGLAEDFEVLVDRPAFGVGFRADGPMRARLERVPVRRITTEAPALRGLAALLDAGR